MRVFFVMVLILVAGAVPSHGRTESEGTVFNKTQPLESMNNITGSSSKVVSYWELYLVMEWPNSFCNLLRSRGNSQCYPLKPNRFTVHGLWPQSNGLGINCSDTRKYGRYPPFILPQPNMIRYDHLNYYWRDLRRRNGNNQVFWATQYNKHGSCTFNSPYRYLALTLNLVESLQGGNRDLFSRLSKLPIGRRINPGRWNNPTVIEEAVISVTGVTPILHCKRIAYTVQLLEIRFCAIPEANPPFGRLVSCSIPSNCGNSWVFLP